MEFWTYPNLILIHRIFDGDAAAAILELRSLYFVLAVFIGLFQDLKPALAVILVFVWGKMLASDLFCKWLWSVRYSRNPFKNDPIR